MLFLLALGLVTSCQTGGKARPNIVLIVIDTVRADHLPFYGSAGNTAPFLADLASRGVVFEHCSSTSSWTAPATASLFTSLYPTQHGVREGFKAAQARQQGSTTLNLNAIPADAETIAEVLKRAGYATAAATDNVNTSPIAGFSQGFDLFWYENNKGSKLINNHLTEQIESVRGKAPYFLYIHYMDPHRPYQKRAPWYQAQSDTLADELAAYDSEISAVDASISQLYKLYGWDKNTLLIVTADHGEEFLDHGGWDHGRTLYAEVTEIPLLVYSSAESLRVGRISGNASILDILPTLREYAGTPPGKHDQGISLLPVLRGTSPMPEGRTLYADLHSAPWFGSRTLKAIRHDDFHCILTYPDTEELFDLRADPHERVNLKGTKAPLVAEYKATLQHAEQGWFGHAPATASMNLDSEDVQVLRSLGYIN